MEWKLTKEAEEIRQKLQNDEDLDASPFGSSDGFWYDITRGGYFRPDMALADEQQIEAVKQAVELLEDLERKVYQKVVPEF